MDQLKRLRVEKGLSQARLAARAGLDPSTVNQIERGAREASPVTLRKLADALDISIAGLLEEESYPKAQAPPPPEVQEEQRGGYDFRAARIGLTKFCDYWEKRLEDGDIARREFFDLGLTVENWMPMLDTALEAERNEILKTGKRSRDPVLYGVSGEVTGSEILSLSEIWEGAERLLDLGEKLAAAEVEMYGAEAEVQKRREQFTLLRGIA